MNDNEKDFSFYDLFFPLTTKKAVIIIIVCGFLTFFNSLFSPFIYDDIQNIVLSPLVRNFSNIPSFFYSSIIFPGATDLKFLHMYYRPLLFTVYTILYSTFGPNPFPFHALQLVLHISGALLVFFIFSKFFSRNIALFLSIVFLVHPINSEVVSYIGDLQDCLFLLFGLIAFYLMLKKSQKKITFINLFYISFFIILSLLSKDTGILFIFIIFIYGFLFTRGNFRNLTGALFLTGIIYLALRIFSSLHSVMSIMPSIIQKSPFILRVISIPKIIFYYISKFIFPINLAIGQEWLVRRIDFQNFYFPLIIDILFFSCIFICGMYVFKTTKKLFKLYLFFGLWFFAGLGAVCQIVPLDLTVADRWFYFPIIGLLGMIGIAYSSLKHFLLNKKVLGNIFLSFFVFIFIYLWLLTVLRNSQWQTPLQLYSHDVKYAEESPQLDSFLGEELVGQGRYEEAKIYFEKAIKENPASDTLNALAYIYEQKKDYAKAKELYWKNINLKNNLPKYISYGALSRIYLLYEHNPQEARKISESALVKYPQDELLIKISAFSQYFTGDKEKSLNTFQKLTKLVPSRENEQILLLIKNDKLTL